MARVAGLVRGLEQGELLVRAVGRRVQGQGGRAVAFVAGEVRGLRRQAVVLPKAWEQLGDDGRGAPADRDAAPIVQQPVPATETISVLGRVALVGLEVQVDLRLVELGLRGVVGQLGCADLER